MPKQRVLPGSRWRVEDMNVASDQTAQFYETEAARDAAFQGNTPSQQTIVHLGAPPSEDLRWQRHNGTMWIPAALPGDINVGWRNDVVVTNRNVTATHKAVIVISRAPEMGETFTVEWSTADDTATVAEADYTAVPWTRVTFNAGETSKEVEFSVTGKGATHYPAERFFLRLRNPSEGATNFRVGSQADVLLPASAPGTGPAPLPDLVLTLTDPAATAEGDKATIRASLNREAAGDVSFEYSTRATSRGAQEDAPATLYAAAASVKATIPEGATHLDISIQTNEVNAVVNAQTQYFEVVVAQSSITAAGETVATSGHDLVALVAVTRNQYATPNFFFMMPRQTVYDASSGPYPSMYLTTRGNALIYYRSTGRVGNTTFRNQRDGWPELRVPWDTTRMTPVNAQVFYRAVFPRVYEHAASPRVYRSVTVEGRIDIPAGTDTGVGEDWHSPNFLRIPFMPQPGTGLAAWYSQAQYADLQLDLSTATLPSGQYRRICTLTLTRAVGIRLTNTTISYFMRE